MKKSPENSRNLTILRDGNRILVDSRSRRVSELLQPALTFAEKVHLYGRDRILARRQGRPVVFDQYWESYLVDDLGRVGTSLGLLERVTAVLERAGYTITVQDLTVRPRPQAYVPLWERIDDDADVVLRYKQRAVLAMIADCENGRVDCPPGYGKTYLIGQACRLFPKANIVVTTDRIAVLCERIYPELCGMLPSVGVRCSRMKRQGRRVMCISFDSLHHADPDADFVFVDEAHEMGADRVAARMAQFDHARIFGFSASNDVRPDGKDFRVEAICGPVRVRVSYKKSVAKKLIVPVTIVWDELTADIDPVDGVEDPVERQRLAFWLNPDWNRLVGEIARRYDDETQVLVPVKTLTHALYLKTHFLPDYTLVYDGSSVKPAAWAKFDKLGLLEGFKLLSFERRLKLSRRFAAGKLKKVIVTTVWNVGVSMNHLGVLVRADGDTSPINSIQIPGRTLRIDDRGKESALVHDILDLRGRALEARSTARRDTYTKYGYAQVFPKKPRTLLDRRPGWKT